MKRRLTEIQVGVLTVAAVVVLAVGVLWLKNVDLDDDQKTYLVDFEKVEGLREGDNVQVRGIRMGEVKDLQMLEEAVRVTIAVDGNAVLTEEAVITLGEKGIVGQIVLEIDPGTGQPVSEGHIFSGRTAATIASMTDAAGKALSELRGLTAKITELVDEVKQSGNVVQTLQQANVTMNKIDALVDANRDDFTSSLRNLAAAAEGLRDIVESGRIETSLDSATSTLTRADSLMADLHGAAARLDAVLTRLESGDGSLARLLNDPALHDRADSTLTSVQRLADAMRRNPKRFFDLDVLDF